MKIEAPCKINLHLRVKGKRPDGYHSLESIFLALSFADTLTFEVRSGRGGLCAIRLDTDLSLDRENFLSRENSIRRAVELFRERSGFDRDLEIALEKRIPLGAGLGGGSSDAASSLLALNALAGRPLSPEALGEMAAALGSDVPFFLSPGAAFVSGRGERIRQIPVPEALYVVLVKAPFPSSTAAAFRLLDEKRGGFSSTAAVETGGAGPLEEVSPNGEVSSEEEGLIAALGGCPSQWPYGNDFLPLFLEAGSPGCEAYGNILEALRGAGAEFSGLTGTGSTCFGIFSREEMAERAVVDLSKKWNFVRKTFPLARSGPGVLQ